jgi:hypothetical protein
VPTPTLRSVALNAGDGRVWALDAAAGFVAAACGDGAIRAWSLLDDDWSTIFNENAPRAWAVAVHRHTRLPRAPVTAPLDALPSLTLNLAAAPPVPLRELFDSTKLTINLHPDRNDVTITITLPAADLPAIAHAALNLDSVGTCSLSIEGRSRRRRLDTGVAAVLSPGEQG